MATYPHMLLAYDEAGDVVATLDHVVARGGDEKVTGLVDFAAIEETGGQMTDVWNVEAAKGSKVWPEWIGSHAHSFRVELDGPDGQKRISALVHKVSGFRRERAVIDAAIQARIEEKVAEAAAAADGNLGTVTPEPADIRDLVGGPNRPLALDEEGKTIPWVSIEEAAEARGVEANS